MELQDIKQFLTDNAENEDVKGYLQELSKVTVDGAKSFLDTDEGKKLLQPRLDSHFTKGLETWKSNNLQKLLDEEIKKRYPEKDPKELENENLRAELEQFKKEILRKDLKSKALTIATEKKLPVQLIDFLIGENDEQTTSNLSKLEEVWNSQLQALVDEKLKGSGTNLGDGKPPVTFTKEQIQKMTPDEINKNWDAIKNLKL